MLPCAEDHRQFGGSHRGHKIIIEGYSPPCYSDALTEPFIRSEANMKRYQWKWVMLFAIVSVLVAACGSAPSAPESDTLSSDQLPKNANGYADINVQQLAGLLQHEDITLVNVHVPYEGEIPQTDLFIPYDQLITHLDLLPDKDAPVVLYCRSGGMSTSAASELAALGYTNVLEVDGGFNAWKADGYELLDNR